MDLVLQNDSTFKRKRHEMHPTDDNASQDNGDQNHALHLSTSIMSKSGVTASADISNKSSERSSCNAVLRLSDAPVLLRFPGKTVRVKRRARRAGKDGKNNSRKSAVGGKVGFGRVRRN